MPKSKQPRSPVGGSPYSEFNYRLNENGQIVQYGSAPEDYLTDVLSVKATDFIDHAVNAKDGKPFFMYIATYAPHGPATPAPRHEEEFPDAQAPRTPSFNEEDVTDKPAWLQSHALLTAQQIAQIDALYRKRLQSMLAVEDLVESVIQKLRATGQLQNTYIFFTSDNGFHQGQHRLMSGKNTGFEEDLRVPLVVRGPGVPAGRTRRHFTVNIDFAPTFAGLGGATVPDFVDGRSLVPLLTTDPPPARSWRQVFLLEHEFPGDATAVALSAKTLDGLLEPPDPFDLTVAAKLRAAAPAQAAPVFQGLHTAANDVYIEYSTGELELYDLNTDPDELDNIAQTADPELLARLASRLKALRNCAGAECRAAENAPP